MYGSGNLEFMKCKEKFGTCMKTIAELEKYLEDECYSFQEITIGKHYALEGIVIERVVNQYNYAYSERGNKKIINSFSSEKELVDFALQRIKRDKWNRAHLIAWVWSEFEISDAEMELKSMNIDFIRNDIPNYSEGKCAYRIFVFGKDVLYLDDFKKKYFKH